MATLPSRLIGAVQYVVRAESRLPALFRARLVCEDRTEVKASMRNVSRSGFMAMVPKHIPAGSQVTLRLPVGPPVVAYVRWAFNDRVGCRVAGRFELRQLALLMVVGALNSLVSPAGIRFVVAAAVIAMYLLA